MTSVREREPIISDELSAKIDSFIVQHGEPYSIADAMRTLGRPNRPPAYLRPHIREILLKDGITNFFHPEITEETFRKICLVAGFRNPRLSETRKQYWQERGKRGTPRLNEQEREVLHARKTDHNIAREPLPEDAARVQIIIEGFLQNSRDKIPQELVVGVKTFFGNNLREHYLIQDLLDATGITRNDHGTVRRRTVKMLEERGIVRRWKTAPLLIPLPMAICACLEMGSEQPRKEARPKAAERKNKMKRRQKQQDKTDVMFSDAEAEPMENRRLILPDIERRETKSPEIDVVTLPQEEEMLPDIEEPPTTIENTLLTFNRHDAFGLGILFRSRTDVFKQFGVQLGEQDITMINRIIDPIIMERRKMGEDAPSLDQEIIPLLKEKLIAFSTGDHNAIMVQSPEEMRRLLWHIRELHPSALESLLSKL